MKWPHFVFKVGYRQDEKSLRGKMTEHYEALASVCTFLTFDIDYADPTQRRAAGHFHPASVSLWTSEPDYGEDCGEEYDYDIAIHCVLDAAVFRDREGSAMDGELILPFKLFIPAEERSKLPDEAATADVRIAFSRLSQIIYTTERRQRGHEAEAAAPRVRNVKWVDRDGSVTREKLYSEPKRRRAAPDSPPLLTRARTRSASQPRRSERIRSQER